MWMFLPGCKTVSAIVTGFITATYSARNAISAGFNLKDIIHLYANQALVITMIYKCKIFG